jgi:hypothetical protein
MDFLKFVYESTKDGAAWGLFAFSFIINIVLCKTIHFLYKVGVSRNDKVNEIIHANNEVLVSVKTLMTLLLNKRR